jgi:hypothetical protein
LKKTYRIIRANAIKEISYLGKSEVGIEDMSCVPVNISKLRNKELDTIIKLRDQASRIGIGVSKEAQELFNGISKTYEITFVLLT